MALLHCPESGHPIKKNPLQEKKPMKAGMKKTILIALGALALVLLLLAAFVWPGFLMPSKYHAGDIITFGVYPQGKNGEEEPIEWIVLEQKGQKVLALSKYGLDDQPYNTLQADTTWESCSLREWLNSTFLARAFTEKEQSAIVPVKVDCSRRQGYPDWDTDGGSSTRDCLFLLSFAEANKYFGVTIDSENNMEARVAPTSYAVAQGAFSFVSYMTEEGLSAGSWWLRSPGSTQDKAAFVHTDGSLGNYDVLDDYQVVRPAMWLDLSGM